MPSTPEISVIVSTYERPGHLERCLASLAGQTGVEDKVEVVVSDDGSADHTAELVDRFARSAPFPVRFVTQPHDDYRLARVRNNGARASTAPYLLFTDGDCVFPRDHLAQHLAVRQPGIAYGGDAIWLSEKASEQITLASIRSGAYLKAITFSERRRLRWKAYKSLAYQAVGHPNKPRMIGCNMAVFRHDFEAINGFDETFVGWGSEDDDFGGRLRNYGIRLCTILHRTCAIHIWHPRHPSRGVSWNECPNSHRIRSKQRLIRCVHGLVERDPADLSVRVVNDRCRWFHMAWPKGAGAKSHKDIEVEVLVFPGAGQFTPHAEFRVLVAEVGASTGEIPARLAEQSNLILQLPTRDLSPDSLRRQLHQAIKAA